MHDLLETLPDSGDRLGDYEILDRLGTTEYGLIYRAHAASLDTEVAILVLVPRHEPAAGERLFPEFENQTERIAELDHLSTPSIIESGRLPSELPYLVTESVEGTTLETRLTSGALPLGATVRIAKRLLLALTHAHNKGVLHLDLSPSSVLLSHKPTRRDPVRLMNLGLAPLFPTLGAARYASPERLHGMPKLDGRADLYSLGLIIAECLTGSPVVTTTDPDDIIATHGKERGLPFDRSLVLSPLFAVIKRACEKEPRDRFRSALEMRQVLETLEASLEPAFMKATQPDLTQLNVDEIQPPDSSPTRPYPAVMAESEELEAFETDGNEISENNAYWWIGVAIVGAIIVFVILAT